MAMKKACDVYGTPKSVIVHEDGSTEPNMDWHAGYEAGERGVTEPLQPRRPRRDLSQVNEIRTRVIHGVAWVVGTIAWGLAVYWFAGSVPWN